MNKVFFDKKTWDITLHVQTFYCSFLFLKYMIIYLMIIMFHIWLAFKFQFHIVLFQYQCLCLSFGFIILIMYWKELNNKIFPFYCIFNLCTCMFIYNVICLCLVYFYHLQIHTYIWLSIRSWMWIILLEGSLWIIQFILFIINGWFIYQICIIYFHFLLLYPWSFYKFGNKNKKKNLYFWITLYKNLKVPLII